jgi:hypothetical protein
MNRFALLGAICALLVAPRFAAAIDVWDAGLGDDDSGTDNELASGSEQIHDLQAIGGVPDQDWYLLGQQPFSSYEVIVDGLTEEVASIPVTEPNDPLRVDLVDSGGIALQAGVSISVHGGARTLSFQNATGNEIVNQYVRVRTGSDGCFATCTANAKYRILVRETTLLVPRFNNSGSQTTVLILQNGASGFMNGTARFWSPSGTLLGSSVFFIPGRGTLVLPTQTVVPNLSGSITIDHIWRYGWLTGKAVALEPSTGFTFDTPVLPKLN